MHAGDFTEFYREVHGWSPFAWQEDLVREVLERNSWPSLVDVPTGLGKTNMLDIAIFVNALVTYNSVSSRIGHRRIFFVVDRRIVVDQAEAQARQIKQALQNAPEGTVSAEIASRLRELVGPSANDDLLPVVKMRGGVTWDSAWLKRPDQPAIVTGTVDQVGSRLFFRGYGASPRRWPIDAALVGADSLILIDEAHLARALSTTLSAAASYDQPPAALGISQPSIVQLTATAHSQSVGWAPKFDVEKHLSDPIARRRITASKTLRLETTSKGAAVQTLAKTVTAKARIPGTKVLVVCNTIDRARAVHDQLLTEFSSTIPLLLLIGRNRSYDREVIVEKALDLFGADRDPIPGSAVLVATQTVEVGVDLDATDLVSESAAWESIVQRLGRVNRRGLRSTGSITIVHDEDPNPPVYGEACTRTARFLQELIEANGGAIDVSPLALRRLTPPADALSQPAATPLLLPAHLDAWARTGPAPTNDAPLDAFLHGIDSGVAPVSVAWRDGLVDESLSRVGSDEASQVVDSIPVRAEECIEVPLSATRRWLSGLGSEPVSDWDDDDDWDIPFGEMPVQSFLKRAMNLDGTARWQWASPADLRPGDLIVVPTEIGGLDGYGWAPDSKVKVMDVAELAALERNQPTVRLDQSLSSRLGLSSPGPDLWETIWNWQITDDPDHRKELGLSFTGRFLAWLECAEVDLSNPWSRNNRINRLRAALEKSTLQATDSKLSAQTGSALLLPIAVMRSANTTTPWQQASDDNADGTVHLAHRVTLAAHCLAVSNRAQEIATQLKLPDELVEVVRDAARWHDLGKIDPRFQAMLFDGDPILASIAPEPLAKSGMPPGNLQQQRDARRRAGLPRRARHEAWSEALINEYLKTLKSGYPGDSELLLHLIISHHGHARPLLPLVSDNAQHSLVADIEGILISASLPRVVDISHAERFHALNTRYGRWGLALLEAIIRCADMTVSEEGS